MTSYANPSIAQSLVTEPFTDVNYLLIQHESIGEGRIGTVYFKVEFHALKKY